MCGNGGGIKGDGGTAGMVMLVALVVMGQLRVCYWC